jgi:hypothetical protein
MCKAFVNVENEWERKEKRIWTWEVLKVSMLVKWLDAITEPVEGLWVQFLSDWDAQDTCTYNHKDWEPQRDYWILENSNHIGFIIYFLF